MKLQRAQAGAAVVPTPVVSAGPAPAFVGPPPPPGSPHGAQGPRATAGAKPNAAQSFLNAFQGLVQDGPGQVSTHEEAADALALNAMRGAVLGKDGEHKEAVIAWAKRIDDKTRSGQPSTVLEHTALTFLLHSDFFAHPEDDALAPVALADERKLHGEVRQSLKASLSASWKHLTGKERPKDQLLTRLPKAVLRKASREARVYHAAAFIPVGDLEAQKKASSLLRDFVPENQDFAVLGATLLAGAFNATAGALIASTLLSHAVFSFTESVLHGNFAHSTGKVGKWVTKKERKNAGFMERSLHRALNKFVKPKIMVTRRSHEKVHHNMTFKSSFTEMFDSPEHKAKVDAYIESLPEGEAKDLFQEHYGITLNRTGVLNVLTTSAPQVAAMIAAGIAFGAPPAAYLPLVLYSAAYVGSLKDVHPHLHDDKDEALAEAGPLMKKVLESRWAAWACRNHWLHHKVDGNYNVSFPGADALLGVLFQPNLEDLFKMRDDGVLHY